MYGGRVNGGWEMNPDMSMADLSESDRDLDRYLTVPDRSRNMPPAAPGA